MKKIFILCGLLILTNFLFAQNLFSEETETRQEEDPENKTGQERIDWSGTNSGDYVIYRDYSWKVATWIGFLYYDKNTIGAFLYSESGNIFVKILFSGEELDGEFITTGQNIISGRNDSSSYTYAVNYLMKLLPNLYRWKEKPVTESLVVKKSIKTVFEPEFGGESTIHFSSFVPLFFIDSILNKEQTEVLKLQEIGLAKNEDAFFNFKPIKIPKEKVSSFSLNMQAEQNIKNINGISLNMDSQWKQDTENSFLLNNTAFLAITPVDFKDVPDIKGHEESFIIKYLCSSGINAKVLLDKTDVHGNKEKFKIISAVYDVKTNTIITAIKLIVRHKDLRYTIISLTVDHSAYKKYKEYFDNLF